MILYNKMAVLAGCISAIALAGCTSALAQSAPASDELSYLTSLDDLALDMGTAPLVGEQQYASSSAASNMPQLGLDDGNELANCEIIAARAEAARLGVEAGEMDGQVSDDYLADLTNCLADLGGEAKDDGVVTLAAGS